MVLLNWHDCLGYLFCKNFFYGVFERTENIPAKLEAGNTDERKRKFLHGSLRERATFFINILHGAYGNYCSKN